MIDNKEKKLKRYVDKYFEKYMMVSFDKFIENWEELQAWDTYKDNKIKILQKENEELRRFRYTIRKDETKMPPVITRTYKREYDELQEKIKVADRMLSEFNTKLMEILKIGISIKDIGDIQEILKSDRIVELSGDE